MSMLFERFISRERNEPPDIDVDFEHERREEVIQYLYAKYGRERAALAATVICYRPKSAVRDVGKALGLEAAQVGPPRALAAVVGRRRGRGVAHPGGGLRSGEPARSRACSRSSRTLIGFPRHLSQHVGGFVIASGPLDELVPIENAAMPERTVIQWDKDDLDELGCSRSTCWASACSPRSAGCFASGRELRAAGATRLATVPAEDPASTR